MELLIMKNGKEYVRVRDDVYLFVGLDKASVFPLEELEAVQGHIRKLQARGFDEAEIRKLTLTEEPYDQQDRLPDHGMES